MAAPAKPRNNFIQDNQESGAILIVVKDRFLPIASGSQMIECTGILDAQRPAMTLCYNNRGTAAILDLIIPLEIQADDGPITRSVGNFCYFFLWLKFSASVFAF
jgi:hypothetical protein